MTISKFSSRTNYKRIYRKVIRAAKAYEINKKLQNTDNFSRTAWEIINQLKNKPNPKPINLRVGDTTMKDSQTVAEEFNGFFQRYLKCVKIGQRNLSTTHQLRFLPWY